MNTCTCPYSKTEDNGLDRHRAYCPASNSRERIPKNVQIVETGPVVTAVYIPDPEQAKKPHSVLEGIFDPAHDEVEVVAVATRFYQTEGASFSGWVVRSRGYPTDPIPNKLAMMSVLNAAIVDYFGEDE